MRARPGEQVPSNKAAGGSYPVLTPQIAKLSIDDTTKPQGA
jgi:hypothetical protein